MTSTVRFGDESVLDERREEPGPIESSRYPSIQLLSTHLTLLVSAVRFVSRHPHVPALV